MIGNILFGIGVVGCAISLIWWIIEVILHVIRKDHLGRILSACIAINVFNLFIQIGNLIIKSN